MHLLISVSYFVCAVSLTHTFRLCKPHLARYKYIISRHLHWMQLKLESFSSEMTCLHTTVSVRVAVTSLPAPLAIKGSARNRQDVRLTGRSPIWAGHAKNPFTGRSVGASLIKSNKAQSFLRLLYGKCASNNMKLLFFLLFPYCGYWTRSLAHSQKTAYFRVEK